MIIDIMKVCSNAKGPSIHSIVLCGSFAVNGTESPEMGLSSSGRYCTYVEIHLSGSITAWELGSRPGGSIRKAYKATRLPSPAKPANGRDQVERELQRRNSSRTITIRHHDTPRYGLFLLFTSMIDAYLLTMILNNWSKPAATSNLLEPSRLGVSSTTRGIRCGETGGSSYVDTPR